jgi:Family of unknown function (DUF6498)
LRGKSTFKLIISEITAVGVNVVPLTLWLFEDYSAETTMVLYALESIAAVILAVLCVLLLAPVTEKSDTGKTRNRGKIITDFLLMAGVFTIVLLVFLFSFIFLVLKAHISPSEIKFGMLCIAAFQFFEFFSNLFLLRPLSLKEGEILLTQSFGGLVVLHISILTGVFLAAFVNEWFVVPFIVLKTIVDVAAPIQFFTGKSDAPPALTAEVNIKG